MKIVGFCFINKINHMKKNLLFCAAFLVTSITLFAQTIVFHQNPEDSQSILPTSARSQPLLPALCGSYNVGTGQTYATLTAAISDLSSRGVSCPVSFILTDNTYPSEIFPITIGIVAGTSFTNTVTIKPGTGKTPVITGSSTSAILILNGCKYIIIDGSNSGGTDKSLTWVNTNTTTNTYTIELMNGGAPASNITIKNCLIRASNQVTKNTYGIFLDNTNGGYDSIMISNNTIYSARFGIQFQGVAAAPATNGQIINNIIGSTTDAQAVQFKGIFLRQADNTLIQGNEIMGAPAGNANTAQAGIWMPGGVTNTRILQNKIHDWYYTGTGGYGNYGIYYGAGAATPTEISNNVITNIKADGDNASQDWMIAGIYINSGGNIRIYNNSIWLTGGTLQSALNGWSACLSIYSGINALNVRNNIFKNSMTLASGTTGNTYAVYCASANTVFGNINFNDYYDDGVNPNIGYLGGNQPTLPYWQAATLQDIYSLSIDPLFTGPNDLHTTVAGLGKAGAYIAAVQVDITGTARTNPPDIGAYQFSANPTCVTFAATGVLPTSAQLNGGIYPNNAIVTTAFEIGLTTAYGTTLPAVPLTVSGNTLTLITNPASGLTPCTLYHYRTKGTSGGVTVYGNDVTFNTGNLLSTVTTVIASGVLSTSALLNGLVNANNFGITTTSFDYGPTWSYGTNVPGNPLNVTGNSNVPVQASITGLTPGTLYHYRVNGTNACGTTNGTDMTFTTMPAGPTAVTLPATGIGGTSATVNGTVNANGNSTTVIFYYGLTTAYGSTVPGNPSPVTGSSPVPVNASLTGLLLNTTYHFQVCGTNVAGSNCGSDLTFTTGCPQAGPAGSITGPTSTCQGGCGYVYTVAPIANATGYIWILPVGATIIAGANTNSITVCYSPTALSGNVCVYGTAPCGNGAISCILVTINPPAAPTIAGPASVCVNSTGKVYTTQSGMTNYIWTVTGGTITAGGGTNSITVNWTTVGANTVCVNYNSALGCPAISPACYNVTVNPLPVPTISGPNPACTNLPGIVYTTQAGMTSYVWSTSLGGQITGGNNTNAITVLWTAAGAQSVSVNYTNANGCIAAAPTVYPVTINATTIPTITGSTNLCANSGYYNYTTQTGMTNYSWTVSPGGSIGYGQGTNTLQVVWPFAGPQFVTVTFTNPSGCSPAAPTVLSVTVNPLPDPAGGISGSLTVCAGATGIAYSVLPIANALTYVWTLPPGATIASGAGTNSITVNFASNASSGDITVYGNNTCGNGASSPSFPVTVTPLPGDAGTITGSSSVCIGSTGELYSVTPIANATGYFWTVPAGATIIGSSNTNSITVDFGPAAVSGNITVYGMNSCGNGTVSPNFAVMVNPIPPAPVIGALGDTLASTTPLGNQWYFEGTPILGATGQIYIATQTGHYWDVVTLNSCSSDTSNHVYIVITGIIEISRGNTVTIYPNPSDGQFTLVISSTEPQTFDLSIVNNLGMTIFESKDLNVKGTLKKTIDLRPTPEGVYTILLKNNEQHIVKKIIINK